MYYYKTGFPEDSELVLCTVTKIYNNYIFVVIDSYHKQGMIHISEISPGRIRNIRDYVTEGKKIFCKVLRINQEKGHIDLSLRRVSEGLRRKKADEIKQEQKSEKIIEFVAQKKQIDVKKLYEEIRSKVLKNYEYIHECFMDVSEEIIKLEEYGLNKDISDELTKVIKQRIKPAEIIISGTCNMKSTAPDGVERIKKILIDIKTVNEDAKVFYLGGGKYKIEVIGKDYKETEKELKNIGEHLEKQQAAVCGTISFEKDQR